MDRPVPLAYLDYREFLAAHYRWKKEAQASFSYRSFSRRAKLKSPNHLKRVIDGERNLSTSVAEKFAIALDLDPDERRCFFALVAFNQAETPSERASTFRILAGLRGIGDAVELDYREAQYHEHWFIPAIRELAALPHFRADPEWLARKLVPEISPRQASLGLAVLFDLGLLVHRDDGRAVRSDSIVTTGKQAQSIHLRRFHATMLRHAITSIHDLLPEDRDISSLTFSGGPETMTKLKRELERVRRELITFAAEEEAASPDRIFQLGLYAFPLSTCSEDSCP